MVENYLELPYVEAIYLWAEDWYDGPISGVCEYQHKKYWFEYVDEFMDSTDINRRRYTLHELPPEQVADLEKWRELYVEKVASHCEGEA